jgi:membrane-associated phospholipid phosphatase
MGNRKKSYLMLFSLLLLIFISPDFTQASDDIEQAGNIMQVLIPVTAYGFTYRMDDEEGRNQFYKLFFTTFGITYGLKFTIDKKRPNGGSQSFPSGHTSTAFSGASFIQKRYGWKYGVPAYMAASFVGWSRVKTDDHYVEDVLAGAAIGVISSYYFTEPYRQIIMTPIANSGMYGLTAQMKW